MTRRWSWQRCGLASMCFLRSRSRNSNTRYSFWSLWITSSSLRARRRAQAHEGGGLPLPAGVCIYYVTALKASLLLRAGLV